MSCQQCGSNEALPSGATSCTRCRSCAPTYTPAAYVPCAPQPYYQQASMCPEDNRQRIYIQKVSGNFKLISASAMPACGGTVTFVIDNVESLPIGAWFWIYTIGFLTIVSYNPVTGEAVVRNDCPSTCQEQAAAGTPIPACSELVLTVPTCGPTSNVNTLYPYLALDFTAPPECPATGCCIGITVTNVNGLSVNKSVAIGSGVYRIDAITDATHITICNDGLGATEGTPVIARDGSGNYIIPIVLIDTNPCLNDTVLSGAVMVCDGNVTSPLTGSQAGQVLVLNDPETGEANYRTLGIPVLNCTELTVCLTLNPDLPLDTPYLVIVVSTADFTEGQIVTIGGTEFVIDSIDDATHMQLIPEEVPTVVQTYNVGSTVCSADCCTILENRLDNIFASANYQDAAPLASAPDPTILDTVLDTLEGNTATLTFTNTSDLYTMQVHVNWTFRWRYDVNGEDGENAMVFGFGEAYVGPNPLGALAILIEHSNSHIYTEFPTLPGVNPYGDGESNSFVTTVAPGASLTIKGRSTILWSHGDVTELAVYLLVCRISYAATALIV